MTYSVKPWVIYTSIQRKELIYIKLRLKIEPV
jgi:hypothetical protein